MKIKPTTVMLLGFSGIVVYLLVSSAKKSPSQTTGPVLAQGGTSYQGGGTSYQGGGTPTAQNPAGLSGTAQGGASGAGGTSDFNNALQGGMDGGSTGVGTTGGTGNAGA